MTGFYPAQGSTDTGDPLAIVRARCALKSTSSNLFETLSMQSSTVMRAMTAPPVMVIKDVRQR